MRDRHVLLTLAVSLVAIIAVSASAAAGMDDRRSETLASGTPILAGVMLEASTPIATLLADMDAYEGQVVQIEGTVVAMCKMMGCWAALQDAEGNRLNVKVEDGVIDFREIAETEHYMVAEGVFQKTGEHGAQVFIMEHGAVVSE